jgi:hypothetical protein
MEKFLMGVLGAILFLLGIFAIGYLAVLMWCGLIYLGGQIPL